MELSESLIILQLKRGNEHAYKYVFDTYLEQLRAVAKYYLHDDFTAESIIADVIFHLWEIRDNIEIHTSLQQYLVRSVRNRCLDQLKSVRFRYEQSISALPDGSCVDDRNSENDQPLNCLLVKELEQAIGEAIENLPTDCRRVFKMSRMEGKKNGDIANELSLSVNTVKYHMKNALRLLQRELG